MVVAADEQVVNGALAGGGDEVGQGLGHGRKQHVGDALGGLHVTTGHAMLGLWVDQRSVGGHNRHGSQASLVGRRIRPHDAVEHIEDRRHRYCQGGIDAARTLGGRACEVRRHGVSCNGDGHGDGHRLVGHTVVVHVVQVAVGAVGYESYGGPGQPLRVAQKGLHVLQGQRELVPGHYLLEAAFSHPDRGQLGGQVALALLRSAGVAADELHHLLVEPTVACQLQGRDDQPFLVQFRGQG